MSLDLAPFTDIHWQALAPLLVAHPFPPYAGYPGWSSAASAALYRLRLRRALGSAASHAWVLHCAGEILGLLALRPLDWDSQQLALSAGRLDALLALRQGDHGLADRSLLLAHALAASRELGIQHLSLRLDASDLLGLQAAQEAGFLLVDGLITCVHQLSGAYPLPEALDYGLRIANEADADTAADLARRTFIYDRFHADPAIPSERADALHAEWLRNACRGQAADAVLLAEDRGALLGFVTCQVQSDTLNLDAPPVGTIVLVATAPHARRRGVAAALTRFALAWFQERGLALVEVGTQLRNLPAARLYQSCGFLPAASHLTLRKLV